MPVTRLLAAVVIVAVGGCHANDVCRSVSGTCVALHVVSDAISTVEQLAVATSGAFTADIKSTPSSPQRKSLPIDVSVSLPSGAVGNITFDVWGVLAGSPIAHGSALATVTSGAHTIVKVQLVSISDADAGIDLAGTDEGPLATKGLGELCANAGECGSGFCSDGVCCDTACGDACRACNLVGAVGTCSLATKGSTPLPGHGGCGPDPVSSCMRDGTCNSDGSCHLWAATTLCKAASCAIASNKFTSASRCDGQGVCVAPAAIDCAPDRCKPDQSACYGSCTDSTQCSPPNTCNTSVSPGSCGPKGNGASCSGNAECTSASASTTCAARQLAVERAWRAT